jgi:hypothetical protein
MKTAKYNMSDGSVREVEYDEQSPCRICGEAVLDASVGGTNVCPWCDCGKNRDGTEWTESQHRNYMRGVLLNTGIKETSWA